MRTERFYADTNRSDNLLHIETDGCVVSIRVGLTDADGNAVTAVSVSPDDESRGGDGNGRVWHTFDSDGNRTDGAIVRVVRRPEPAAQESCQYPNCHAAGGREVNGKLLCAGHAADYEAFRDEAL